MERKYKEIFYFLILVIGIYLSVKQFRVTNFNQLGAAMLGGLFMHLVTEGYNEIKKRKNE
jgi:hypothetical protein